MEADGDLLVEKLPLDLEIELRRVRANVEKARVLASRDSVIGKASAVGVNSRVKVLLEMTSTDPGEVHENFFSGQMYGLCSSASEAIQMALLVVTMEGYHDGVRTEDIWDGAGGEEWDVVYSGDPDSSRYHHYLVRRDRGDDPEQDIIVDLTLGQFLEAVREEGDNPYKEIGYRHIFVGTRAQLRRLIVTAKGEDGRRYKRKNSLSADDGREMFRRVWGDRSGDKPRDPVERAKAVITEYIERKYSDSKAAQLLRDRGKGRVG